MKRLIPVYMLILFSCNTNSRKVQPTTNGFIIPTVLQQAKFDSLEQWNTNGINEVFPKFIGQFKFTDTVNIDEEEARQIDQKEYKWENRVYDFDTLSSDGLQIYPDYSKTIISSSYMGSKKGSVYFPVYVVNETRDPKLFIAKDDYVFAIQEAVDTSQSDRWYAIESSFFDFCGNGYFRRRLMPQEFIVFLMPKYSGSDTTFLRTRISIGENVIVSSPYQGCINKNQFRATKGNSWYADLNKSGYKWMLYGARNKE